MKIYIPTAGRPDRQITSDVLMDAGIDHIVVQSQGDGIAETKHREVRTYDGPPGIRGKRQWIMGLNQYSEDPKILMMDDDLKFRKRATQNSFVKAGSKDVCEMIDHLSDLLTTHAHVGMIDEFMCNSKPRGFLEHGRYNSLLGYNTSLFPSPWPEFRLEINEDHDFSLQLQAAGLAPAITCEWTRSTKPYAPGGCALFRTPEVELEGHRALARLWPSLVTVKETPGKSLSGYGIRVKWREALKT